MAQDYLRKLRLAPSIKRKVLQCAATETTLLSILGPSGGLGSPLNYHTVTHNISRVPQLPPLEIAPCIHRHLSPWLAVADAILLPPVAALPSAVTASTVAACRSWSCMLPPPPAKAGQRRVVGDREWTMPSPMSADASIAATATQGTMLCFLASDYSICIQSAQEKDKLQWELLPLSRWEGPNLGAGTIALHALSDDGAKEEVRFMLLSAAL
jgi:hypothetical protein